MQQIVTTETHNGVKGLEYRTTLRTATGKGLSGLSTYGSTPEESRKEMAKHIQERDIRWMANATEQAEQIRTAAEALVAALTQESDDYDGLVYYEYAKELADLQMALSKGWLSRSKADVEGEI